MRFSSCGLSVSRILLVCCILVAAEVGRAAERAAIEVKSGQKIAFLGDSITSQGCRDPLGYARLVTTGLQANGIQVELFAAGRSGNCSNDMLARVDRDVIEKKPDWLMVSCGVNDVNGGQEGVPLDKYIENVRAIVAKAQAASIRVMILTATMIGEDARSEKNRTLASYNDFLRELAVEKKCLLANLNAQMQDGVAKAEKAGRKAGGIFLRDELHMNAAGNILMATGVLKAFGCQQEHLARAEQVWLDIPGGVAVTAQSAITLRDFRKLEAISATKKKSVSAYLSDDLAKRLTEILK